MIELYFSHILIVCVFGLTAIMWKLTKGNYE